MTIETTISDFARLAQSKTEKLQKDPLGFAISSMMAGAYVGLGILLIFSLGQNVDPSIRNLVMGASFGIALTLVVFAGSELFTGHTMYFTIGRLTGVSTTNELVKSWVMTWFFNLFGAMCLAIIFVVAGGGEIVPETGNSYLIKVAEKKMTAPAIELIMRGMLCNWLVCLALWGAARTKSDITKCLVIFWCLYAFIAAGFEHSIANMTIFSIALLYEHTDKLCICNATHNLLWVTFGNILSGAIFMGVGYWIVAGRPNLTTSTE